MNWQAYPELTNRWLVQLSLDRQRICSIERRRIVLPLYRNFHCSSTHFSDQLDRCVRCRQVTPITQHALSIQWVRHGQCKKLSAQQHPLQIALLLAVQRNRFLLRSRERLQSRIVKEHALPLTALHQKQRRPFLVETSPLAIDKSSDRLDLRRRRRCSTNQRRCKRNSAVSCLRNQTHIECPARYLIDLFRPLPNITARHWRTHISCLPGVIGIDCNPHSSRKLCSVRCRQHDRRPRRSALHGP